ncbi:mechanosensitive ion channel family protein [Megasphaera sp.]|uniref:mechanosensitive ion channel family protein n=2 Tax=Megasphaera TaxID=906 RepID=UPI003520CD8F
MNIAENTADTAQQVANVVQADVQADVQNQVYQGFSTLDRLKDFLLNHGPDVIYAIIIFMVGRYVARAFKNLAVRMMTHANYDHTVITFVSQLIYYAIMALVLLSALNKAGIPTNSFLAAFGAFGLAVGLALQSNLSNFASGLLILVFKPFKAGDWISVGGVEGSVKGIQMMNTAITTKDNKTIFIPNSSITSSQVTNSSYQSERYITFYFDISYQNDHHKVIALLKQIFREDKRVLNADTMEIGIREFADNSVRIAAFPKVANADYFPVYYDTMSKVKDAFDANGIDIPYPQRVVYIQKSENSPS